MQAPCWVYIDYLAPNKTKSNQPLAPGTHRPFWFDFPNAFYTTLQKAAVEFGTTRAALVTEAIKMRPADLAKESKTADKPGPVKESLRQQLIKDFRSRASAVRWQGTEEEPAPKVNEDFTRIFWLDLPPSFFKKVTAGAKRYNVSEKAFVRTALTNFIDQQRKARRKVQPISSVQEELIKEFSRAAGQARWEGVNKAARKKHAQAMAKKRWEHKSP
jgi:hypothetical protein